MSECEEIGRVLYDPSDDETPIMIDTDGFMSVEDARAVIRDIQTAIARHDNREI